MTEKPEIDEYGQVIGDETLSEKKEEKNPIFELAHLHDAFFAQSVHPNSLEKPDGILYWRGARLEHYKQLLSKMEELAQGSKVTEFIHPASNEKIVLSDFFDMIKKSINYSEDINQRLATEEHNKETIGR